MFITIRLAVLAPFQSIYLPYECAATFSLRRLSEHNSAILALSARSDRAEVDKTTLGANHEGLAISAALECSVRGAIAFVVGANGVGCCVAVGPWRERYQYRTDAERSKGLESGRLREERRRNERGGWSVADLELQSRN